MRIQSKFRILYKLYIKYILNYINIFEMGNENRFMDFFFLATPHGLWDLSPQQALPLAIESEES